MHIIISFYLKPYKKIVLVIAMILLISTNFSAKFQFDHYPYFILLRLWYYLYIIIQIIESPETFHDRVAEIIGVFDSFQISATNNF